MANKLKVEKGTTQPLPPKRVEDSETDWRDPWEATKETRPTVYHTKESFLKDLRSVSRRITDDIDRDPEEAARLRKSREEAREGKRREWRDADE